MKTLAEEAGLSRNAIYHNHAEIIEEMRKHAGQQDRPRGGAKTHEATMLRKRVKEMEDEQRRLVTENAQLLARATRAERELNDLKRQSVTNTPARQNQAG